MPDPENCDHLFVQWEPYQINNPHFTDTVVTVHWFSCEDCPVRTNVVDRVSVQA